MTGQSDTTTKQEPEFLIDQFLDGYIEERAWVEKTDDIDTPEKAVEWVRKQWPASDREEGEDYACNGALEWERPVGVPIDGTEIRHVPSGAKCGWCNGTKQVQVIRSYEPEFDLQTKQRRCPDVIPGATVATGPVLERMRRAGVTSMDVAPKGCEECYGTGEDGTFYFDGEIPWEGCEPDAEGAVQFWVVHVVCPV
jgi:hypothetical protein